MSVNSPTPTISSSLPESSASDKRAKKAAKDAKRKQNYVAAPFQPKGYDLDALLGHPSLNLLSSSFTNEQLSTLKTHTWAQITFSSAEALCTEAFAWLTAEYHAEQLEVCTIYSFASPILDTGFDVRLVTLTIDCRTLIIRLRNSLPAHLDALLANVADKYMLCGMCSLDLLLCIGRNASESGSVLLIYDIATTATGSANFSTDHRIVFSNIAAGLFPNAQRVAKLFDTSRPFSTDGTERQYICLIAGILNITVTALRASDSPSPLQISLAHISQADIDFLHELHTCHRVALVLDAGEKKVETFGQITRGVDHLSLEQRNWSYRLPARQRTAFVRFGGVSHPIMAKVTEHKGKSFKLKTQISTDTVIESVSFMQPVDTMASAAFIQAMYTCLSSQEPLPAILSALASGSISSLQSLDVGLAQLSLPKERSLNASQQAAVERVCLGSGDRLTIIQGPPGTGKTRTIASIVKNGTLSQDLQGIYLSCMTNEAVRNLALACWHEGIQNFLLVGASEMLEWFETRYNHMKSCIVDALEARHDLDAFITRCKAARLILCTIDMLSHPALKIAMEELPVSLLVVDEASQVALHKYLSIMLFHGDTIVRAAFFGDDKQLPPYGADKWPTRSIFQIPELSERRVFLKRRYRMPSCVGDFLSSSVYGGLLESHNLTTFQRERVVFVDVGGIANKRSNSWQNRSEADVVVKLLQLYGDQSIGITPYVGQRSLITELADGAGIHEAADRVITVDGCGGQEKSHIVISTVRQAEKSASSSNDGHLPFILDQNRTNVMLSRCIVTMTIVTSRAWLLTLPAESLLRKFAEEFVGPGLPCSGFATRQDIVDGNICKLAGGQSVVPSLLETNYAAVASTWRA